MKKIFSLLCAMVLVMSASAVNLVSATASHLAKSTVELTKSQMMPRMAVAVAPMSNNSHAMRAPQAAQGTDFSSAATYVEAAYWGSYTYDPGDYVFYFVGGSNNLLIYADVYSTDETHIAGTYDFADGSIYEASVVVGNDTIDIANGTITVAFNSTGNYPVYDFAVNFVGVDGETYTLNAALMVVAYDYLYEYYGYSSDIILQDDGGSSDPYSYDEQTNVTISYTSAEATLEYDDSYQALYGVVKIFIDKNDGSDELYLKAVYSTPLVGGVMPDGVYQITATEAEGTFLASSGYDGRYVYPCLYGLLGTSGGVTNAWFLVSGTVTISNNGQNIAVAATNSNGNTINYTFVNGPQAVENVEGVVKAMKSIKNGQLVIEKNGVEYNAQGAKL